MFLIIKALLSGVIILLITTISKKASLLGGIVAMMPFNIILSLIWLNYEKKDTNLLWNFSKAALFGVVPTIVFLLFLIFFLQKNFKFSNALLISIAFLGVAAYLQYKLLKSFYIKDFLCLKIDCFLKLQFCRFEQILSRYMGEQVQ